MAKRRRKSTPKRRRIILPARFAAGDRVRVRPGVADPDYPDIPLGGWAGVVEEINRRGASPTYLVAWDQRTVAQLHPVYRKRCERDDLDVATMWLTEADLEPDTGEASAIEQPTQLVTRPLRLRNREDRIRMIFGLTSDDPIPSVSRDTLRRYHAHLAERLTIPFPARFMIIEGERIMDITEHRIDVFGLLDPSAADLERGLRCEGREGRAECELPLEMLVLPERHPNRPLIDDYAYWFDNWPADSDARESEPAADETAALLARPTLREIVNWTIVYAVIAAIYGGIMGGAIGAVKQAGLAAEVGAGVLGLLGILVGIATSRDPAIANVPRVLSALIAGSVAALIGGQLGALLAALVAAYPGARVGGLIGAIIGGLAARGRTPTRWSLLGGLIAGMIGSYGLAVAREPADALTGALYGAGIGAAGGALVHLVQLALLMFAKAPED